MKTSIHSYNSDNLSLKLDVVGNCQLIGYTSTAISGFKNVSITGSGNLTVKNRDGTDATIPSASGANGAAAISANNLTVENMSGTIYAYGGNGGNGSNGTEGIEGNNGVLGSNGGVGGNGGNGGNSYTASKAVNIDLENINITFIDSGAVTVGYAGLGGERGRDGADKGCSSYHRNVTTNGATGVDGSLM